MLTSVKSGPCWNNVRCGLVNEELITNVVHTLATIHVSAFLWKKTGLPVRGKSARNEWVNHLYNVWFICTVPVLFALRVNTYLIACLLTPCSRVLPEKLTGFQLVKKFSAFYGSRRFITAVKSARHLSLSWASSITPKYQSRYETYPLIVSQHDTFYVEELLAPRPIPKPEDHPLSAVRDCLFNIFAAALHIGGRSSIRNLRTRHAVVTGTHLSLPVNAKDSYVLTCCAKCVYEF